MKMFEQIGEFTPDSLIVSADFPILKIGIGLKAGQGVLKRGTLIMKGADNAGYIAGKAVSVTSREGDTETTSDMEMKVFGILADNMDTGEDDAGENIPAVCYQTGIFNRSACIVDTTANINDYEDEMREKDLFLRNVQ